MKSDKLLVEALRRIRTTFEYAKSQEYIRKPLAYALYEVWKYVDQREKERSKMTCKDCKKWENCEAIIKSDKYEEDGDSWANWCEDFDTIHEDKEVRRDGIIVHQTGYNWHVTLWDEKTGKMLMHMSCTKEQTEEELLEMVDVYNNILEDERSAKQNGHFKSDK